MGEASQQRQTLFYTLYMAHSHCLLGNSEVVFLLNRQPTTQPELNWSWASVNNPNPPLTQTVWSSLHCLWHFKLSFILKKT